MDVAAVTSHGGDNAVGDAANAVVGAVHNVQSPVGADVEVARERQMRVPGRTIVARKASGAATAGDGNNGAFWTDPANAMGAGEV